MYFLESTYNWYHICLSVGLTLPSMITSRSIHVATDGNISFFLWLSKIPFMCVWVSFYLFICYPFNCWWTLRLGPCLGEHNHIFWEREEDNIHITFLKVHYNCSIYQLVFYISLLIIKCLIYKFVLCLIYKFKLYHRNMFILEKTVFRGYRFLWKEWC